jgi:hypothetical protein
MKGRPGIQKAAPLARPATSEEILRAIEALTDADNERLEQFAISRILRIGRRAAAGRSHEDLLHESLSRLIDGPRHWFPGKDVSFAECLMGVIRSLSSAWAGHRARNADSPDYAGLETELSYLNEERRLVSPFERLRDTLPTVEQSKIELEEDASRQSAARALRDAIMDNFADDELAALVLLCLEEGKNGPAIQAELNMTEPQFRTVTRRIQRRAKKIREEFYGR